MSLIFLHAAELESLAAAAFTLLEAPGLPTEPSLYHKSQCRRTLLTSRVVHTQGAEVSLPPTPRSQGIHSVRIRGQGGKRNSEVVPIYMV